VANGLFTYGNYPDNGYTAAQAYAPSGGNLVGDVTLNSVPAAGGNMGWVCTTAGSPGTWKSYGAIAS